MEIERIGGKEEEDLLELIENWLKLPENAYLNANIEKSSLLCFIRGSKYRIDMIKDKIVRFYEMRGRLPEWFKNRDAAMPEVAEVLSLGVFIPLGKDRLNRTVVILRTGAHNPRLHKMADIFKVSKMLLDLILKEDETAACNGIVAVFDMAKVGLGHALQMTPNVIKNSVESIRNYPSRTKGLIFVNSPIHINIVLNIFRSFMSDKMKKRITVYGNGGFAKLMNENVIPADIIPNCYGGTGGEIKDMIERWKTKSLDNRDWFLEDEKYAASQFL